MADPQTDTNESLFCIALRYIDEYPSNSVDDFLDMIINDSGGTPTEFIQSLKNNQIGSGKFKKPDPSPEKQRIERFQNTEGIGLKPRQEKLQHFLSTYGEWVYRFAVILGFVAVLWLNQNYVTKSDFSNEIKSLRQDITQGQQQINSRIDALVNSVNAANTAIAVTQQRQSELDDLKQRIRDLERENRQK